MGKKKQKLAFGFSLAILVYGAGTLESTHYNQIFPTSHAIILLIPSV